MCSDHWRHFSLDMVPQK